MAAKKTKKWHWKILKPVYFMEEKVEEDFTIADTEDKAFSVLKNGYGNLQKSDVRLLSSKEIELYGALKAAMPSSELLNEDISEEVAPE